jgi:hypothetical protein
VSVTETKCKAEELKEEGEGMRKKEKLKTVIF